MENFQLNLIEGEILLDRLLKEGVDIAHDCGGVLACSSCRVIVREGLKRLDAASNDEVDMLDRAEAAEPGARLACQVVGGATDLVIQVPRDEAPARAAMRPVSMSARAAKHFAAQLAKHPGAVAVRLAVRANGCSGFGYRVDPADVVRGDDQVFESGRVRIVVDAASLPYLQGATLDVVQEGLAQRVRFDNPNARQSCGCGESFGV
ncbi:MAG: iron-sulfur cluster assembly accessory protein [Pseudomonadota bacterium]|nr:iron-sulfur cluster assembly accessory protein [Pseudomonadota bacterium]